MTPILNFFKGLTNRHVDWATRHGSKAYDRGQLAGAISLAAVPVVVIFACGFVSGWWCR